MDQYTCFSAHAGMAALGPRFQRLWAEVEQRVHVPQKTIRHTPTQKLLVATLNILAGGQGVVEVNTRLRSDPGLLAAYGCPGCADQSVVSATLNACGAAQVAALRRSLQVLLRRQGQCPGHYARERLPLLLGIDLTGLVAGRQGEGVNKGYYSGRRGALGRQLVRVLASSYDEVVYERLYPGQYQLVHVLEETLEAVEETLAVTPERRRRTALRLDAGAGDLEP